MSLPNLSHIINYQPEAKEKMIDFKCGNSLFSDNEWDFSGLLPDYKHLSGARLVLKFHMWEDRSKMLDTVKWYMVSVLLISKWSTAKRMYDGLKSFLSFLETSGKDIISFSEIDQSIMYDYFSYLLQVKSQNNGQTLSPTTIQKSAQAIKDLLVRGSNKEWDVPKDISFLDKMYEDMIINNKKTLKKNQKEANNKPLIDKETLDNIISCALVDLEKGEDVFVAASIILTSQIGLRINEFLTLRDDCLINNVNSYSIKHYSRKLNKEEVEVTIPINEQGVFAINALLKHTEVQRKKSSLPYLFINPNRRKEGYPVELIAHSNWGKNFLKPWLLKHEFVDKAGKVLPFTSHTFRHCFATYAISNGASIELVSNMMGHRSIRGTQHYAKPLEEDIKERFSEVFNEGAILSGKQAIKIKDKLKENNPFKGKTIEQVDSLRKAMKIQVLSHGLCTHHPMRNEPCMGDGVCLGCQNFLTTPDYLEIHKSRLKNVREQLIKASSDGPYESKLKHIEHYLVGIIEDLEKQMKEKGIL